jgi:hypothetical protein
MARDRVASKRAPESAEERRAQVEREIRERYPDLRVTVDGDQVVLRGSFPVVHEGEVLERYLIEITLPAKFPEAEPMVRELGGRIPVTENRHVYTNGALCLFVPEDWFLSPDRTILTYLDGPLRNFFIGESLVARGLPRKLGERSHRVKGLLEAYGEMVGSGDPVAIRSYLEYLGRIEVKGHWDCPCGSGRRLRDCHLEHLRRLRDRAPQWIARSASARLRAQVILEARAAGPK